MYISNLKKGYAGTAHKEAARWRGRPYNLVLQKRNCAGKSLGIKKLLPEKVSELVLFRFLGLMMLWRVGNLGI